MTKWQGTPVPNTGYVENVYFNTNLSVDEVVSMLNTYKISEGNGIYCFIINDDVSFGIIAIYDNPYDAIPNTNLWRIIGMINGEQTILFNEVASADDGVDFVGWNTNITYPLTANINAVEVDSVGMLGQFGIDKAGLDNDKLSSLFSTTPFVEVQEKVTLNSFLTSIADAIRSKKGTTDKINASNFASEINSIESGGGAVIKTIGGWQGTAVPNSGYVENVYFNTALSVDEVVDICNSNVSEMSVLLVNSDMSNMLYITIDNLPNSDIECWHIRDASGIVFCEVMSDEIGFVGWNPNLSMPIIINSEVLSSFNPSDDLLVESGAGNTKLSSLFSTTPFVQASGESIGLSGEYDGSSIEVSESVDMRALIDEKKIPLLINVKGGSSVIEVDELPTENIQEGVIYQVNEVSDIDVYLKDDGKNSSNLETSIIYILGITPTLIYEVVDSLPSSPNVSNLQTFSPAYIYIQNDIPYVYGNAGYGDMWLDVKTLIQSVTNLTYENKGYVASTDNITEAGLYVTYKKGKQGLLNNEYHLLEYTGGWNDYKKIFDKTIVEYKNDKISEIQDYAFYECNNLETVDIPNVTNIFSDAFNLCNKLKNLNIPKIVAIHEKAFYSCKGLMNLNLPNLSIVGRYAFADCGNIGNLIFPKVTSINDYAFSNTVIGYLILDGSEVCTLGQNAINANTSTGGVDVTFHYIKKIYVPDNLVDAYKNATNWSVFAAIIKPLSEYVEE